MKNQIAFYKKRGKIILLLNIAVFIFWFLSKAINVYYFAFVGAIFEILWLPIIALTFVLPILSAVYWRKEKFIFQSFNFYSIVVTIMTILLIIFHK